MRFALALLLLFAASAVHADTTGPVYATGFLAGAPDDAFRCYATNRDDETVTIEMSLQSLVGNQIGDAVVFTLAPSESALLEVDAPRFPPEDQLVQCRVGRAADDSRRRDAPLLQVNLTRDDVNGRTGSNAQACGPAAVAETPPSPPPTPPPPPNDGCRGISCP